MKLMSRRENKKIGQNQPNNMDRTMQELQHIGSIKEKTLGLLSPRRHVVWCDSVGVESSGSGLKIRVRGYFASELSLVVAQY